MGGDIGGDGSCIWRATVRGEEAETQLGTCIQSIEKLQVVSISILKSCLSRRDMTCSSSLAKVRRNNVREIKICLNQ